MSANGNWFLGLPVSAAELPAAMLDRLPPGLIRLHPGDLHLTVAFLGAIGERRARRAWEAAQCIEADLRRVTTGAPVALGTPARPSVVALEIDHGRERVAEMITQWRNHLRQAAGVPEETRPVRPHITIARLPRRAGRVIRERTERWLSETPDWPRATLSFDRIALFARAEPGCERAYRQVAERCLVPPPA